MSDASLSVQDEIFALGRWRSCTGCHEHDEGHPTGPYNSVLRCHLGNGCHECGGIGATWEQFPDEQPNCPGCDMNVYCKPSCPRQTYPIEPSAIADQPPPVATERRPCWDIVIEHTDKGRGFSAYGKSGTIDLVLADMRERDRIGRERYGTPLTSDNGRDHLIDAYQEALDYAVYLAAELDKRGVGPDVYPEAGKFDKATAWHIHCVQKLFHDAVNGIIRLRAMIEERPS
jgi:hypothetical protein